MELQARVQKVADLAGNLDRMDQFSDEYVVLLAEITGALKLMKGLAVMQGGWLQGQAGKKGRDN